MEIQFSCSPTFCTLLNPPPAYPRQTAIGPSAACIYRTGHSFTIHTKCGETISQDFVAYFLLQRFQFLVDRRWDATYATIFSSPVFHVSLKIYVNSDSKNIPIQKNLTWKTLAFFRILSHSLFEGGRMQQYFCM